MIDLQILGRTVVRRDGQSLDSFLRGPKRLGLLAYLVLARPRGFHRRDELLPLFWPERGQTSARNALSNMLYHIRRELGEDVIVNRGTEEIGVQRDRLSCDVLAFEAALDRGDHEDALALYRGDLLQSFHVPDAAPAFDQWLDQERERLRLRAIEGAWACAETAENAGDDPAARAWAKRAAGFAPFSDESQTRLIALLERTGDRAGAREAYEAFAERLRTEWDMEPTAELTALIETMSDTAGAQDAATPPASPSASSRPEKDLSDAPHDPPPPPRSPISPEARPSRSSGAWGWRARWAAAGGTVLLLIVGVALGRAFWSGGSAHDPPPRAVTEPSVAVLPFTYIGAADSTDYFSLGITEEVLTRLAQVSDLSVISRTSVMPYRHTEKPLRTIGQELGASAIVEGSVQRVGNDVRITAQLIDARTDRHLWSARYDRRLEDVFAMQSDIAKAIAGALEAELAPGVEERIERAPTDDLVAYELYLHGRDYFSRGTKEESKTATDLLEQAIARDPNFALARAALAKVYARDAWAYGGEAWQADSALAEAERAAALTPDLADAHAALGRAHMAAGRFTKASAAYERAIELNPNDWGAVNDLAIVYLQTGRLAAAIQQWKRVLKGNPASAHGVRFNLALAHRVLGLLDRAEQGNRAALALKPDHVLAIVNQGHVDLFQGDTAAVVAAADRLARDHRSNPYALQSAGWLLIFVGQPEQARAPLERAYALSPTASGEGYVRVRLGYALWETGERERAAQLFEAFERFANEQIEKGNEYAMLPYSLAAAHAAQGETQQALEWLEQAVDRGWPYELTTVNDPLLASLRGDARFQTLVDRMREQNSAMRRQLAQAEGQERADWLPPE
mgnify:FL=1